MMKPHHQKKLSRGISYLLIVLGGLIFLIVVWKAHYIATYEMEDARLLEARLVL